MGTFTKQMKQIVEKSERQGWDGLRPRKLLRRGRLNRTMGIARLAAIQRCAEDLAKAMREEYFTDAKGRRVRAKHLFGSNLSSRLFGMIFILCLENMLIYRISRGDNRLWETQNN